MAVKTIINNHNLTLNLNLYNNNQGYISGSHHNISILKKLKPNSITLTDYKKTITLNNLTLDDVVHTSPQIAIVFVSFT
jgi:hypothetical protein